MGRTVRLVDSTDRALFRSLFIIAWFLTLENIGSMTPLPLQTAEVSAFDALASSATVDVDDEFGLILERSLADVFDAFEDLKLLPSGSEDHISSVTEEEPVPGE
jgi:hypothetical protein